MKKALFLFSLVFLWACKEKVYTEIPTTYKGDVIKVDARVISPTSIDPDPVPSDGMIFRWKDGVYIPDCVELAFNYTLDAKRYDCEKETEKFGFTPKIEFGEHGAYWTLATNSIPDHDIGLFGEGVGIPNPFVLGEFHDVFFLARSPTEPGKPTYVYWTNTARKNRPKYAFGVSLNGIELDPAATEPWRFEIGSKESKNWGWTYEALQKNLGLDCNAAHLQPIGDPEKVKRGDPGRYHYHGIPSHYHSMDELAHLEPVGYAADGYPIYYKYGFRYDESSDSWHLKEMTSSYQLREGRRPGLGLNAPCGAYNGKFTQDWEFVERLGDLDECNGYKGPNPAGYDYYYVITEDFPVIPRCFVGTPHASFEVGE